MKNIILCGFMGSGKTTVGRLLAEKLGLVFFDTDELIERKSGMRIAEIFEKYGEAYFRSLETETIKGFLNTENNVISLGGGLAANEANHSVLKKAGFVILLDCGIEETLKRITDDKNRPLTAGGQKSIIERYHQRFPIYKAVSDVMIDSCGDLQETTEKTIRLLEEFKLI